MTRLEPEATARRVLRVASAIVLAACSPNDGRNAAARASGDGATTRSTAVAGTGRAARRLLTVPGFAWRVHETVHARVHAPSGSAVARDVRALADSAEAARAAVLSLLGERDVVGEPKLELFLVDSRDDMQRLIGRPYGGFAQPGELVAAFVAGPGYKPFLRHELTHAYASVRWGRLEAGTWLTEGLAALAQGPCQGHSVDALAAGYLRRGAIPPLAALAADIRAVPELPGYMAAASVADFLRRREGIQAVRALWRGERAGTDGHPLGTGGPTLEREWRAYLSTLATAVLDSAKLRREGC